MLSGLSVLCVLVAGVSEEPVQPTPLYRARTLESAPLWSRMAWRLHPAVAYAADYVNGRATVEATLYMFGDPDALHASPAGWYLRYAAWNLDFHVNDQRTVNGSSTIARIRMIDDRK
jgi:hypothetical protein